MTGEIEANSVATIVLQIISQRGATSIEVRPREPNQWEPSRALSHLFEDPYSIIGVANFTSTRSLVDGWVHAQDTLMRIVARAGGELGAKAWDTYLILVADEPILAGDKVDVAKIRGNTRYARKLVISADDLSTDASASAWTNVTRSLAPILPVVLPADVSYKDPLATLPNRLASTGIAPEVIEGVIMAHRRGLPLIAELHARLSGKAVSE